MCYRICEEIADSSPRSGAGLPLDENLFFNSFFDLFLVSYTPSLPDVSCSAVKPGVSGLIVLFYSAYSSLNKLDSPIPFVWPIPYGGLEILLFCFPYILTLSFPDEDAIL